MTTRRKFAQTLTRTTFSARVDWLVPVVAHCLPGVAVVLTASLLAAALGLALPMLTKQVIDAGIMARDMSALVHWSLASFALGLGAVALGAVNGLLHLRASSRMLADLRQRVYDAAMARDPARHGQPPDLPPDLPLGEAMSRIDGDSAEIQRFAFDTVLVAVGAVFRLVGGIALMALLDWRLVLLPLLITPIELIFLTIARPRTQALAEQVRDQRGTLSSTLTESLIARPTLTALNALNRRSDLVRDQQGSQISGLIRQREWSEIVSAVSQILAAVTRGGILLIGGWLVVAGHWQLGTLIAYLAYAAMMQGPLRNLLGLYHAQARAKVALHRLDAVFTAARPDQGTEAPTHPQRITLQDLRASGAHHQPLCADVLAGQRVLLDGPSGIGKTRLMSILTRDAPAEQGRAELDGADIAGMRPSALRGIILHLPQRPVVLRGTLAENLRLAAPDATDEVLWRALEGADLAIWARGRDGLDTPLAETGADMSGGMRQRLSLARAFLVSAPVTIFDESLSEIDEPSARRILSAIARDFAGRTQIWIAHNGPAREQEFDQRITLSSIAPLRRNSRGGTPYQRENAREKAV